MNTHTDVIARMEAHGEETYPEECCGFLLGRMAADGNEVAAAYPVVNEQADNRNRRYIISPQHYLTADREARRRGMDIVGIYHSHPDHPAEPSQTDLEWATFPGFSYVIVSIREGKAVDVRAWSLAPDRSRFLPEEIELGAAGTAA